MSKNQVYFDESAREVYNDVYGEGGGGEIEYIPVYLEGGTLTQEQMDKVFYNGVFVGKAMFKYDTSCVLYPIQKPTRETQAFSSALDANYQFYYMEVVELTGAYTITQKTIGGGSDLQVNVQQYGDQIIKNLKVGDVIYENELPKTEIPVGYSFDYEAFVDGLMDAFPDDYTFDEKLFDFGISLEADGGRRIQVGINKQQNSNVIDVYIAQNGEFITKSDDLYLNTYNIGKLSDLYENASVINYFSTGCTLINKIDVNFAMVFSIVNGVENTDYVSGQTGLYLFTEGSPESEEEAE